MSDSKGATWTVQAQTPRTRVGANNQVEDGYDVTFLTGAGNTGTVFVPSSRYNVDTVRAAVQELADRLDAVGSLSA